MVTKSDSFRVRGIMVTRCPVEETESGKDFEIKLDERDPDVIRSVTVDGRRLLPKPNIRA